MRAFGATLPGAFHLDYRFIRQTEKRYAAEVEGFLDLYRREKSLGRVLGPVLEEVGSYLLWLRWVGWNIANLGPALFKDVEAAAERLALSMLAYVSGRLIDDGLDDHESFKGHRESMVGLLRRRLPPARARLACAQSAFIGFCLFHHAVRRMEECGQHECARIVSRLFDVSSAGVLGECFAGPEVDAELYWQIVRRKAVGYNMILYKPFLVGVEEELRLQLLGVLAGMDELSQLINDYYDVEEDSSGGRLNAFTHGVYDRRTVHEEILERARRLRVESTALPPEICVAVTAMLENVGAEKFAVMREGGEGAT